MISQGNDLNPFGSLIPEMIRQTEKNFIEWILMIMNTHHAISPSPADESGAI